MKSKKVGKVNTRIKKTNVKTVDKTSKKEKLVFCLNPFLLIDGSPNDQLLTVNQPIILDWKLHKPELRSQPIPVENQMGSPRTMIAHTRINIWFILFTENPQPGFQLWTVHSE